MKNILNNIDLHKAAYECFGITLPIDKVILKKCFRDFCLQNHPDQGGNPEVFIQGKKIYEILVTKPTEVFTDPSNGLMTRCGTPLSELGLGLGASINGIDCEHCKGAGYTTHYDASWAFCTKCQYGYVPQTFPCKSCHGTGKFTQANSKRVVDCHVCSGTGKYTHPRLKMICPDCRGTMAIHTRAGKAQYYKCDMCNGTGETEMFNPVLRKMALGK